jgi:hypothetical protein
MAFRYRMSQFRYRVSRTGWRLGPDSLEILIAVLLGLAAVATAYAGYKSSSLSGEAVQGYSEAAVKSNEATFFYSTAVQGALENEILFIEYEKAKLAALAGNSEIDLAFAQYLRESLMTQPLLNAIDWWEGQPTDEQPVSPFVPENPEAVNLEFVQAFAEGQRREEGSSDAFDDATEKDDRSDEFTLATVLLATSLFILGVAGVFRVYRIKAALVVVGAILLVVPVVQIILLDRGA